MKVYMWENGVCLLSPDLNCLDSVEVVVLGALLEKLSIEWWTRLGD